MAFGTDDCRSAVPVHNGSISLVSLTYIHGTRIMGDENFYNFAIADTLYVGCMVRSVGARRKRAKHPERKFSTRLPHREDRTQHGSCVDGSFKQ